MRANPASPQRTALHFLFIAVLCTIDIVCSIRAEEAITDQDKRIRMLTDYVVLLEPRQVPVEYGRQLIPDLVRLLNADEKVPDLEKIMDLRDRRSRLLQGLIKAIKTFEGYDEAKLGRQAVYDLVNNAEVTLKREAMGGLVRLDGEGATDMWLQKLRDWDESIRVNAAILLGEHGRVDAAAQIEKVIQERTRGQSTDQIAKDHSLKWMRAAIAEMQDRAKGKAKSRVSERVNAADLIESGPGNIKPPDSTPDATLPAMAATKSEPTIATPAPIATAVEPPTSSSGFLWTCAAAAIALLVSLVFFWKRRPS